jgi:hypothetical protein
MWDQIWVFAINHYIFHTVIITGLVFLIFGPKKYKKVVFGKQGLELITEEIIDPKAACPYTESKELTRKEIAKNREAIDKLTAITTDIEEKIVNVQKALKNDDLGLVERLTKIESGIGLLSKTIANIRKFQRKISQGTLENMLFNERQSIFKRLKAFRRLLAMGINGEIKQEGIKLVLEYKDMWKIVLQTKLSVKIKDIKYYEDSLSYINKFVFDKL